jgi:hypothetical protein
MPDYEALTCEYGCLLLDSDQVEALALVHDPDRLASALRLRRAWHELQIHNLPAPGYLTANERASYVARVRRETSVSYVYEQRRRIAFLYGGPAGLRVEINGQRRHPNGMPHRVLKDLVADPKVRAWWEEQERAEAAAEKAKPREMNPPVVGGKTWLSQVIDQTIDELLHGGKDA